MNRLIKKTLPIVLISLAIIACSANKKLSEQNDGNVNIHISAHKKQKPNILLIQADDLGFDDISIHGNKLLTTPNLDALAKESVRFNQFYVSSVCAPTRASLLTGRHFLKTGVSGVHAGRDFVNLNETLLSEVAQQNNYTTAMWGKWHSGKTEGYFPWDRGFEQAYYATLYNYFDNVGLMNGEELHTTGFATDRITDFAIDFINDHHSKPFFAYISYMAPHNPWRAPVEKISNYISKGLSKPMATLYGMIDNLDFNIGRVLQQLENSGIDENTIVIFISDNGPWTRSYRFGLTDEEWNLRNPNQRKGSKAKNWDNGIHSPLFVRWKGHYQPKDINQLSSVEDLYPTIVDWMNSDYISSGKQTLPLDGVSLQPLIDGKQQNSEKVIFSSWASPSVADYKYDKSDETGFYYPLMNDYIDDIEFEDQRLAIRLGDYKLVRNEDKLGTVELYNIKLDPGERNAIYNEPEVIEVLNNELETWYDSVLKTPHVYSMPEFQVGFEGREFSQIYATSTNDMSLSLVNSAHALSGWDSVGQQASYKINVHHSGSYEVRLILNSVQPEKMKFSVKVGEKIISSVYERGIDQQVNTLVRYESAYWENFDLSDSFKSSIHNFTLGTVDLNQHAKTLTVSLSSLADSFDATLTNEIISIQLYLVE
ncbi:sulfatase-like hydrolase/transferase [Paraglaciecola arctica]|uniref:sulfatase-like hydrolase/transferase n=1 Tax=Paraglaciecola arctica TaxID=1128911 RepID=UPI001C07A532|nr:sulfatase-like hydrolase/transferase [Paraglaciecola arctica]MBU3005559.1 sulfatase-like hydrolase/transferase [Paraglaciecola arctica]